MIFSDQPWAIWFFRPLCGSTEQAKPRSPPSQPLTSVATLNGAIDDRQSGERVVRPEKAKNIQTRNIFSGRHPLSGIVPDIFVHPSAAAGKVAGQPGEGPTCGTCFWRIKGRKNPQGRRCGYGDRASIGANSSTRSWWPACREWVAE